MTAAQEQLLIDAIDRGGKEWKTGIYQNVGMVEYSNIQAANFSRMKGLLEDCPYNVRHGRYRPGSKEMKMGTAVHAWCLERHNFGDIVYVAKDTDGRTKEGKAMRIEQEKAADGKTLIDEGQFDQVQAMAKAIQNNTTCRKLAKTAGNVEEVLIFDDEKTGLKCKAKCDKRIDTIAIDLKTTKAKSADEFAKEVLMRNYHAQAAFYSAGYAKNGITISQFWIIAVNNDDMDNVELLGKERFAGAFLLTDTWMRAGEMLSRRLIDEWSSYNQSGEWPKYTDAPQNLPETFGLTKQLQQLAQGEM